MIGHHLAVRLLGETAARHTRAVIADILGRLGEVPGDVWLMWVALAAAIGGLVWYQRRPAAPDQAEEGGGCLVTVTVIVGALLVFSILQWIAPDLWAALSGGE